MKKILLDIFRKEYGYYITLVAALNHWVKSVQIRENTDQKKLRISTLFTQ